MVLALFNRCRSCRPRARRRLASAASLAAKAAASPALTGASGGSAGFGSVASERRRGGAQGRSGASRGSFASSCCTASRSSSKLDALSSAAAGPGCSVNARRKMATRCARAHSTGGGGASSGKLARARYSSATAQLSTVFSWPESNMRGFARSASADMAAAAPVASMRASASARERMLPLAMTGIPRPSRPPLLESAEATAAITEASAAPRPFCARVRPCTAMREAPASASRRAKATVRAASGFGLSISSSSPRLLSARILHVIGRRTRASSSARTMATASSNLRKEP